MYKLRLHVRNIFSRLTLVIVFFLFEFSALLITLAIIFFILYLELRFGILNIESLMRPAAGLIILFVVSLVIGAAMTLVSSKGITNRMEYILNAMKQLAGGDFKTRIAHKGILYPKELREFVEEFNLMAKELGSLELLRSDFVNYLSHEFKTPIVSLQGFARLLKDPDLTQEEREEYLDVMLGESDRLAKLSTNVLNLLSIENQVLLTEQSDIELGEQIRRAMLMIESKWNEKQLELELEMDDVYYHGNGDLLSQVWVNILDNAVKFSPKHGRLEVELKDTANAVIFRVRDYGSGMDEATRTHMFDKFYRGDRSLAADGNGLGMAVTKKIINLHGGEIFVESAVGEGTMIMITLPKARCS